MSPGQNGWEDSPEEEQETLSAFERQTEQLGALEPWEDWPEEAAGPEYWLYKGMDREV